MSGLMPILSNNYAGLKPFLAAGLRRTVYLVQRRQTRRNPVPKNRKRPNRRRIMKAKEAAQQKI